MSLRTVLDRIPAGLRVHDTGPIHSGEHGRNSCSRTSTSSTGTTTTPCGPPLSVAAPKVRRS